MGHRAKCLIIEGGHKICVPFYRSGSGAMTYAHARLFRCFLGARLGAGGRGRRRCIAGSTIF